MRAFRGAGEPSGEVTAFLALILLLLLSFAGGLMESVSVQTAKNYRRTDMNSAVESVFAEYQKELLETYDLFALEGTYESGSGAEEKVVDRLAFYGAGHMEHSLAGMELLSDENGAPFLRQAEQWVRHRYGIEELEGILGHEMLWAEQEEKARKYEEDEEKVRQELQQQLEENEGELPDDENPLNAVEEIKASPLLELVVPETFQISQRRLEETESLLTERDLRAGYGGLTEERSEGAAVKAALGIYLGEHFKTAVQEKELPERSRALEYELEYILSGKQSDAENLEDTVQKIMLFRMAPNYAYLQTDSAKKAEARALAASLCTLLAVPAAAEAVTQALLFAWAFGESIVDIRSLLAGNQVPLLKNAQSWQLGLQNLSGLKDRIKNTEGRNEQDGLSYGQYVQILLFLEDTEKVAVRSLELIEQNIRTGSGASWFYVDNCITKIKIDTVCSLRRGIRYRFSTSFGYR